MPIAQGFLQFLADNGYSPYPNFPATPVTSIENRLTSLNDPSGISIDTSKETALSQALPGKGALARVRQTNQTPTEQSVTVTLEDTVSNSVSNTITTTTGVTTGTTFETTVSLETPFASLSATVSASLERTNSKETSETTTQTSEQKFGLSATINIPPGHTYIAQLMYNQVQATVPYTYNIGIGGLVIYRSANSQPNARLSPPEDVARAAKASRATYPGVSLNDLKENGANASLNTPGLVTFKQGYEAFVLFTDATNGVNLTTNPIPLESDAKIDSVSHGNPTIYYAPYDSSTGIGANIVLDAQHTDVVGTPFADEITAGAGGDVIDAGDGNNIVYGGSGTDIIMAEGSGVNTLLGGSGNDFFGLKSTATGNLIEGGTGKNWIAVSAPETTIIGGQESDTFVLNGHTSGGTEITDHAGLNSLAIVGTGPHIKFEQDGEGLIILLHGDQTFNPTKDILWTDFFESTGNSVDHMTAAHLAALTKDGAYDPVATGMGAHPHITSAVPGISTDATAAALLRGWS